MTNLLEGFQDKLSELLVQIKIADSMPTLPTPNLADPLAPPSLKISGATALRERAEAKINDEVEKAVKQAQEEVNKKLEEGKKAIEDQIKNAAALNPLQLDEIKMELAELGTALGELSVSCAMLPTRIASLISSIIGSCPLGPTVTPGLIPKGLQDLKQIGDDLGTKYDKVEQGIVKLGLNNLEKIANSCAAFQSVPGLSAGVSMISTVVTTIKTALSVCKPLILAVGGSCGGASGSSPEVSTPEISYNASADTCSKFSAINYDRNGDPTSVSAGNCKNFTCLNESKGTTPDCNNCTKYTKK